MNSMSAVHETTGYSPSPTGFDRDLRQLADLLCGYLSDASLLPEEHVDELQARIGGGVTSSFKEPNISGIQANYDMVIWHHFNDSDKV